MPKEKSKSIGPHRTIKAVHSALGHLERRHALASVLGGRSAPDGKAGVACRPDEIARRGCALEAVRRRRGMRLQRRRQSRSCSRRASRAARSRGRRTSICTKRPSDGSRHAKVLTAQNQAWDTQPRVPEGRRPRLPRDGAADLRSRPLPRRAPRFPYRRNASAARTSGIAPSTASASRATATRCSRATDDIGQHPHLRHRCRIGHAAQDRRDHRCQVTGYAAARTSVVYAFASLGGPPDLYVSSQVNGSNAPAPDDANQDMLGQRAMSEYEQFSFRGWNGETVYGYVMKPYGFTPGKRYPVAFVDSRRAAGELRERVELSLESAGVGGPRLRRRVHRLPRLAGLRPKFTDSISQDWGGKPLEDLQKGLAAALAKYDWLDGSNACAAGASYGGFMINWIAGELARSLQVPREPRRHLRSALDVPAAKSCGSTSGRTAARISRCRRTTRSSRPRRS